MSSNPVVWFEIYVEDMKRAKSFYQKVFKIKFTKLKSPGIEMYAFPSDMNGPGCTGSLVKMEGVTPGNCSTLVYFSCEDCAVEASRVKKAGGEIHREKMSIGEYGFIALVLDTEQNMIGLHSMK